MLTPKQKMFCQEYIKDLNATQAAIRAGYSEKTSYSIGNENLNKPEISEYIQALSEKRSERTEITADMVVKELAKIAFMKESEFYSDDGDVKALSELSEDQKSALASYQFKRVNLGEGEFLDVPVFKAQDKMKALELLGKHLAIFTEKIEHSGEITITPAEWMKRD